MSAGRATRRFVGPPSSGRGGSGSTGCPSRFRRHWPGYAALAAEGRSRNEMEISVSPYFNPVDADAIKRYEDAGVDRVIAVVFAFDRDGLQRAADDAAALVEAASR